MKTFEQFLEEVFAKNYMGTDDDMTDKFDSWISEMDTQDLIDWAEIYGRTQFTAGKQFLLDELKKNDN